MKRTVTDLLAELKLGGFTYWLTEEKTTGYLVGGSCPGREANRPEDITARDIADIMVSALGVADTIGGWIDDEDENRTYLDGNTWIPDFTNATELAREREERAIWDIARGVSVYVRQ